MGAHTAIRVLSEAQLPLPLRGWLHKRELYSANHCIVSSAASCAVAPAAAAAAAIISAHCRTPLHTSLLTRGCSGAECVRSLRSQRPVSHTHSLSTASLSFCSLGHSCPQSLPSRLMSQPTPPLSAGASNGVSSVAAAAHSPRTQLHACHSALSPAHHTSCMDADMQVAGADAGSAAAAGGPPALYAHALFSIFGWLQLRELAALLATSRQWSHAVRSMPPLCCRVAPSAAVPVRRMCGTALARHVTSFAPPSGVGTSVELTDADVHMLHDSMPQLRECCIRLHMQQTSAR